MTERQKVKINFQIPLTLLDEIDAKAEKDYRSRSGEIEKRLTKSITSANIRGKIEGVLIDNIYSRTTNTATSVLPDIDERLRKSALNNNLSLSKEFSLRLYHSLQEDIEGDSEVKTNLAVNQQEADTALIEHLAVSASMGQEKKLIAQYPRTVRHIEVDKNWFAKILKSKVNIKNLKIISALGDSMEPTFTNGDLLLVDISNTNIDKDGIYMFRSGDYAFVKRLQIKPDGIVAVSDNPKYQPFPIVEENSSVIGTVVSIWAIKNI